MLVKFFKKFTSLKREREELLVKAKQEAQTITFKAQEDARKIAADALEVEKRLAHREEQIEEKDNVINRERQSVQDVKNNVEVIKKELETKKDQLLQKLEKISGLTKDQAKDLLLRGWEDKLKGEVAKKIKAAEEEIKIIADDKAKQILVDAIRYGAIDYVSEYTLSVINLPSEDYKGRIIGKEGRNIRAFEIATGVDVDLEEEKVIRLSSFDAIRREVARMSLERLIKDGRIQPERIEEIVKKTREEVDKIIFKAGEELAHSVSVFNLPTELTQLLGKFKYRYSYGQNMIAHTLEETRIGVALAHELKLDVNLVKLGCLFHDIGKVVTDKEGSHIDLGVEVLKKNRFPQKVIDCVASHHEDVPFTSLEAVVVYIADAVSGGRPGARHEDFGEYLKRIKTIEDIAKTKKGVKEAYALQAGRELRVIVKPDEMTDDEAIVTAEKIKEELEQKFEVFPGQIKITVIRETRAEVTTKI
ncbi:MAG: Ribonuclease Y [Candidatus Roizmanbacteria bacterium GW2011_GWA2_34_18]|uniref:Ribonuclease Y n=1 Tax=Candidatus Roizmanbacteria bacterium GW2011_GWA2_34_18 TaxID=1618477 RepID=A0A0G0ATR6_9BACT|nr:MAG: Ribonuclease Y [Candidatus Roizmanbacteria bacterium GW2011_GWA2_34_18]